MFFKFSVHNPSEQLLSAWWTSGLCQAQSPQSQTVSLNGVTVHFASLNDHVIYPTNICIVFFKFSVHNSSEQSLSPWRTSGLCRARVPRSRRVSLHGGTVHFASIRGHIIYPQELVSDQIKSCGQQLARSRFCSNHARRPTQHTRLLHPLTGQPPFFSYTYLSYYVNCNSTIITLLQYGLKNQWVFLCIGSLGATSGQ